MSQKMSALNHCFNSKIWYDRSRHFYQDTQSRTGCCWGVSLGGPIGGPFVSHFVSLWRYFRDPFVNCKSCWMSLEESLLEPFESIWESLLGFFQGLFNRGLIVALQSHIKVWKWFLDILLYYIYLSVILLHSLEKEEKIMCYETYGWIVDQSHLIPFSFQIHQLLESSIIKTASLIREGCRRKKTYFIWSFA